MLSFLQQRSKDEWVSVFRDWGRKDLFFLLTRILKRPDADNDWCFARSREVQASPNEHLDLWAREHYKSTIITFALTIQDIINNPEITFGIFSHTRGIAKDFLRQIKQELETNTLLKFLYSDVFFEEPQKQAPQWSENDGIVVKRKGNPKESTIEAWGVVDSQPTGRHFKVLLYDDVVTIDSVSTIEQINKTTDSLKLSFNLGAEGGIRRFAGTRYSAGDTYDVVIKDEIAKLRLYAATEDGKPDGKPRFFSEEALAKKRRDMGPYIFGCQMLQNPVADSAQGFNEEWVRYYDKIDERKLNLYYICDPAGEKKKENDYTVPVIIGLGADQNYYLVYGIRDRLNLTQRTNKLFDLKRLHQIKDVGYEKYGKDSDIEHIETEQERRMYRFPIIALGGNIPKNDRIRKLVPVFEQGRFFIPRTMTYIDYQGKVRDFIQELLAELRQFPKAKHDDILDAISRIVHKQEDLKNKWDPEFPVDDYGYEGTQEVKVNYNPYEY